MSQNENGWQMVRFDQMVQHRSHRIEPGETKLEKYVGLKHIRPGALRFNEYGDPSDVKGIKLEVWPDDVIFAKRGFNLLRKLAVADFHGICSAHSMVLRAKEETLLNDLLPFFILSDKFFDTACAISVGSLSKTINWRDLAKQEFIIPPIEKQKEIAELLWEAEDSIENANEEIERATNLSQGLMNELFSKGLGHKRFKETELGKLPMSWSVGKLGDICTRNKKKFEPKDSDTVHKSLGLEHIESNTHQVIGYEMSDKTKSTKNIFSNGDVLYGKLRPNLNKVCIANFTGVCTTEIWVLITKEIFDKTILFQILSSKKFVNYASRLTEGTNLPRLGWDDFSMYKIPIPPLPEQKQIASILSDADAKIDALRAHREKLVALKASLIETLLDPGTANA